MFIIEPMRSPTHVTSSYWSVANTAACEGDKSNQNNAKAPNHPELIRPHSRLNDDIAYGATPLGLRALFAANNTPIPADFDLDAFGFLIAAPLIYFRLKEWVSGEKVRGLTDERVADMWARLCEPMFNELLALLPAATKKKRKRA